MQEVFYEESARTLDDKGATRKYNIVRILSILSYVFLFLWIFISFNFYGLSGLIVFDILFILIPAVMFFLTGFFLGKAKNKLYVDYDYTFVTGSIRISTVIKNIKRKFLFSFETSDIEKLGKYGSELFSKYEQMPGIKKKILTSNNSPEEGKSFYYVVANVNSDKHLLILECTDMFIVNIIKFSNKTILDEEFVKELSRSKR